MVDDALDDFARRDSALALDHVLDPGAATDDNLLLVHAAEYVQRFNEGQLDEAGFGGWALRGRRAPWSVRDVLSAARWSRSGMRCGMALA